MALSVSSTLPPRAPLVAAVGSQMASAALLEALEEISGRLHPFEQALDRGIKGRDLERRAFTVVQLLQPLTFQHDCGVSSGDLETLIAHREAGEMDRFVVGVLGAVREVHRKHLSLLPVGDPKAGVIGARLAMLQRDDLGERMKIPVPTWATTSFIVSDRGRFPVQLDGEGRADLGQVMRRMVRLPRPSLRRLRAAVAFKDGAFHLGFDAGDDFLVNGELVEQDREVVVEHGAEISYGPVRGIFHLSEEAPPLEKLRSQLRAVPSLEEMDKFLNKNELQQVAVDLQAFLRGEISFKVLPKEGGFAAAVDRILKRVDALLLDQVGRDDGGSARGRYHFHIVELLSRFENLSRFLPPGLPEADRITLLERFNRAIPQRESPAALVYWFRHSPFGGGDLLAAKVESDFAGTGPIQLGDYPSALHIRETVRRLALAVPHDVVNPSQSSMDDPLSLRETSVLRRVGELGSVFLARTWLARTASPGLERQLRDLLPPPAGVGPLLADHLVAYEHTLEAITQGRLTPVRLEEDELKALEDYEGVWMVEDPVGSGNPFDLYVRSEWLSTMIDRLGELGWPPLAHGTSLVFGDVGAGDPYEGGLVLSLKHQTPASIADAMVTLRNLIYRPLSGSIKGMQIVWPSDEEAFRLPGAVSLFFHPEDQESVYRALVGLHSDHERLFESGVPPFAAPVLGADDRPLRGVAFIQQQGGGLFNFGQNHTLALRKALVVAGLLVARGHTLSRTEFNQIAASMMNAASIDTSRPAFDQESAVDRFRFMANHTVPATFET